MACDKAHLKGMDRGDAVAVGLGRGGRAAADAVASGASEGDGRGGRRGERASEGDSSRRRRGERRFGGDKTRRRRGSRRESLRRRARAVRPRLFEEAVYGLQSPFHTRCGRDGADAKKTRTRKNAAARRSAGARAERDESRSGCEALRARSLLRAPRRFRTGGGCPACSAGTKPSRGSPLPPSAAVLVSRSVNACDAAAQVTARQRPTTT